MISLRQFKDDQRGPPNCLWEAFCNFGKALSRLRSTHIFKRHSLLSQVIMLFIKGTAVHAQWNLENAVKLQRKRMCINRQREKNSTSLAVVSYRSNTINWLFLILALLTPLCIWLKFLSGVVSSPTHPPKGGGGRASRSRSSLRFTLFCHFGLWQ